MSSKERLKSVGSYLRGKPESGGPYRIIIEITNACNLRCKMCARLKMNRPVTHMSRKMFEDIIMENKDRLEFVSLNGLGEPLLHPELFEYIKYCRTNRIKTGISTNCTMLTEEASENLLKNGPDLTILAIDGASKESYEKVRSGAKFDEVVKNVKRLLEMKARMKKNRTYIVLQCIVMPETKEEIKSFYRLFEGYKYDAIRMRQLTHTGQFIGNNYKNKPVSCYWLWNEPMVFSDGTVVPCCQDVNGELRLGSVQEKGIADLWNGDAIRTIRNKHSAGKRNEVPICSKCNMYQPEPVFALGAALLNTNFLNKIIPGIESLLSKYRYRR